MSGKSFHRHPAWHLERCWDSEVIQQWWRAAPGGIPNMQPGHLVSHGPVTTQVSVIAYVTHVIGRHREGQRIDRYEYKLGQDVGGHLARMDHAKMCAGHFLFIPNACQLARIAEETGTDGMWEWAYKLINWHARPEEIGR